MSLPHAILGFLREQPLTGYALKTQRFDVSVANFWPADQAQIYRTLDRLELFLQVKDFKPLSRPFLQLLSQPDSCHVAQTHEAHGVATAVCGSKRLVEVRRICCYAPFATPSGGNAGT